MDLSGRWFVRMDPDRQYTPISDQTPPLSDQTHNEAGFQPVLLPGTLRDSGLGNPVGPNTKWIAQGKPALLERPEFKKHQAPDQFKIPFWLQPKLHYVGSAFYQRTVEIPETWQGQQVSLSLERPHWRTQVWVDGKPGGEDDSLSTPHVYDLTNQLTPGRHTLTILVDNSLQPLDVGINSHSVSDHTQSAWHGIVGKIELRAEPRQAIHNVQVFPAIDGRSATVTLNLKNLGEKKRDGKITFRVTQQNEVLGTRSLNVTAVNQDGNIETSIPFSREAKRWDEFNPQQCLLEVTLRSDKSSVATKQISFGIRHLTTKGTRFILNGRPLFLRGTLECCIFPLTGYPPTDVESWKRIIRICKAHGLNHIRFHSWCPPEAAFVAADELGFYFQVECSTWPNSSTSLGIGKPIDEWLYREGERVLTEYGNHPSFLLLAMGNEPGGPQRGGKYLGPWVEHFKSLTKRQLVTSGAGWPSIAENEFHVRPDPRIQQWGQGLRSRINGLPPSTMVDYRDFVNQFEIPVISHEIGQWCVYPNFDEMKKYVGSLQPRNFEIFRELLAEAQMPDQDHDFLMASGMLQKLCYKEEIESALRTPGFGGFQLLDLHDFPGQGTALVGMLDPFWDSKPYMTASEFSHFCGPITPLARMAKRTWTSDEVFAADIEVSHFGPNDLSAVEPKWSVSCDAEMIESGSLPTLDIPTGKLARLGRIELPLGKLGEPAKLTLRVWLSDGKQEHGNDWDFWVYPPAIDTPPTEDILVVDTLKGTTESHLKNGGKVVLLVDPANLDSKVQIGFSSIFWNTAWTSGQSPHTLGVLCDPKHPALSAFPTEFHSNWQWWELVSRSKPIELDSLPPDVRPIVQVVPDWFRPQRLGLIFEVKVGDGKLLVCSIDLKNELEARPVARQLRQSILKYAASDNFAPTKSVDVASIHRLLSRSTSQSAND
ncbi:Beta-galactosidase [Planctomycetes bacterium CA13]|uniref:Beta-galactosidase n=2 Tax=Novipirellula herctigrandis TaxID=2527986 RepID=A0A5C5Z021_9BACT|nr:Beta-galactosidase [Planctomycetes bacterium CA13]